MGKKAARITPIAIRCKTTVPRVVAIEESFTIKLILTRILVARNENRKMQFDPSRIQLLSDVIEPIRCFVVVREVALIRVKIKIRAKVGVEDQPK